MNKNKPVVLLDVDGVIANFVDPFIKMTNITLGTSFKPEDVTEYNIQKSLELSDKQFKRVGIAIGNISAYGGSGMASDIEPLPGAVAGVKSLIDVSNIYFVTSVFDVCPRWSYDRKKWLCKYFGDEIGRRTIFTGHKYMVRGDIFVDDMPYHVDSWAKENYGYAILWKQHYNKNDSSTNTNVIHTDSWNDILDLIDNYDVWGSCV